jgi:ATP-dependent Clp protease ATP-binding subunit ClpA
MMFERFTDQARKVVTHSQDEARAMNHNYIGTEHILLALSTTERGVAVQALEALGVSTSDLRIATIRIVNVGLQSPSGHIPFTPRAKKVLELSLREALQLGHNYIGTEHILLALIREGEGVGARVLAEAGLKLADVRKKVIEILSGVPVNSSWTQNVTTVTAFIISCYYCRNILTDVCPTPEEAIEQARGKNAELSVSKVACYDCLVRPLSDFSS